MILKVDKISKKIKEKAILRDVSFTLNQGECVALIGPNGAGKTTLFNILIGDKFASSGNVEYDKLFSGENRNEFVSILNQQNSLPNKLKVYELVEFYQKIYKNSLPKREVYEILGFDNHQQKLFIEKLSGGQKRILNFVLSIIGRPKILFLDEPTSAMDTETRKKFWNIVKKLKNEGSTILYSSHYIEEVEYAADRILILNKGRLIKDTTPYLIKAEKMEKLFSIPLEYKEVIDGLDNIKDIEYQKDNVSFISKNPEKTWKVLEEHGVRISDIEIKNQSLLDSIFLVKEDK